MLFDAIIILLVVIIILLIVISRQIYKNSTSIKRIENDTHHLFNQIESYNYIKDRLELHHGLPYTTHWSASPDFLKIICNHCLNHKPSSILECSSGLSSLVLARCCEINRKGHVTSLEHEAEYTEKSTESINRYSLQDRCSIIHSPLKQMNIMGNEYMWYTIDKLNVSTIDLLVIDGPPGFIQHESRFPAIPLLYERLADECTIILDDAARPEEKNIVKRWLATYPELEHEYIHTERGCSVFQLRKLKLKNNSK